MSNLRKKVVKQQQSRRLAALNLLGTPVTSDNEDSSDIDSDHSVIGDSILPNISERVIEEELRLCVDDLGEKRASLREAALSRLVKLLSHYYCGFFFDSYSNTREALLQLLLRSIRKSANINEALLALKAIELTMINEGTAEGEQEDLYGLVSSHLKQIIQDKTSSIELKCQSIETLAMITFTSASITSAKGGLDYFYKILISNGSITTVVATPEDDASFENMSEEPQQEFSSHDIDMLLVHSLNAYGLLYASIYGQNRGLKDEAWDEWQSAMPAHLDLLESASKDVRVAAGKNVALMYECSHTFKKTDLLIEDDDNKQQKMGLVVDDENDLSEYEELDELIDTLQRLSTESSRRVNKQDRKEQKSAFRDILHSIQLGEKPKEKLKLGRQRLIFRGWAPIIELHAFRTILGAGLANHFESNELVQNVFSSGIEEEEDEEEEVYNVESGEDNSVGGEDDEDSLIKSRKSVNRSKYSKKYKDSYYD
ncbi:interferon-related developmental regulator-domain-containing protein [Cokeromyces recurvatus]|uniref:interferon-related developmental regulator-domain-containing protein n=1 Tax=Cokeromyces recurvatus TaxID=90255 RepID=UPI00221EF9C0|nr:interferon-related developmental regulator-domain-containing protein [Cokeromyces recurvatus]KAI7905358.1 interferon-related developmental regulator-domain-containing protein [Cokeromyces recurvatus]